MLDLPHHHCNSVYVPWISKGQRATLTLRNNIGTSLFFLPFPSHGSAARPFRTVIVRHNAKGLPNLGGSAYPPPAIPDMMPRNVGNNTRFPIDTMSSSNSRLRIDTQLRGSADENRRWKSIEDSEVYPEHEGRRPQHDLTLLAPTLHDSPVSNVVCDGWCRYDPVPGPIVVNIILFLRCMGKLTV